MAEETGDTGDSPRQILQKYAPDSEKDPAYVRDWIQYYLQWRSLDHDAAKFFIWDGEESQGVSREEMVDAFRLNCRLVDWEAGLVGSDVWQLIQGRSPGVLEMIRERAFWSPAKESIKGHGGASNAVLTVVAWFVALVFAFLLYAGLVNPRKFGLN